jgi:hypothetical protein
MLNTVLYCSVFLAPLVVLQLPSCIHFSFTALMDSVPDIRNPTILCIGARRTGKTTMALHLYTLLSSKSTNVICFTHTPYQWRSYIPPQYLYDEVTNALLETILVYGEANRHKGKGLFLIFDDVVGETELRHSKAFQRLFAEGRHYGITAIVNIQHASMVPPIVRDNTDFVFVFRSSSRKSIDSVADYFLGHMHKKLALQNLRLLSGHESLFVNVVKMEQSIVQAPVHGIFKMGTYRQWNYTTVIESAKRLVDTDPKLPVKDKTES